MKKNREDYLKIANDNIDLVVKELVEFIKIDSVYDAKTITKQTPYGQGVNKALEYMVELGNKYGFKVDKCNGHCTELTINEGKDLVMIMGHADVVPTGNGWSDHPFSGNIKDGKVYGRGSIDDKGPTLAAFHALRILKDLNLLKQDKTYRIVVGGNEERGSNCLRYYFDDLKKPAPKYGFTPDADFPLVYGEKGILSYEYFGNEVMGDLVSLKGGTAANAVPDHAEAIFNKNINLKNEFKTFLTKNNLKGQYEFNNNVTKLIVNGKGAHASTPQLGINAIAFLLNFLAIHTDNKVCKHFAPLFNSHDGSGLGIKFKGNKMGSLTMNLGVASWENDHYSFIINIRYPIDTTGTLITSILDLYKLDDGHLLGDSKPLYVDPNSNYIKTLLKAYQDITLDYDNQPLTIGGGTYARNTINSVAFGMGFPDNPELAHQADEYVAIKDLKKALAIYLQALDLIGDL